MKTARYRFERELENCSSSNIEYLKSEFRAILESNKEFSRKADYIGISLLAIDEKIASIDEELAELKELKSRLKDAKDIASSVGADVFAEYGINKLEGSCISSITITEPKESIKQDLVVTNEDELISLGYFKKVLDTDRLIQELNSASARDMLKEYCTVSIVKQDSVAKLRVNKKRGSTKSSSSDIDYSDFIGSSANIVHSSFIGSNKAISEVA